MTIRPSIRVILVLALEVVLGGWRMAYALDPALDVNEYAHTAWTVRDGFSLGNIYAIAQTPDGYLWLGSEFGLFRFDGSHSVLWQPPSGHPFANGVDDLMVTSDGTLWIATFGGLVTWNGRKLTQLHQFDHQFITALYEDREGTVWVGAMGQPGRLYALRDGRAHQYGSNLDFGGIVWTIYQDSSGTLWAGTETGLWRIKPGPARRFGTSTSAPLPYSGPIGLTDSGDGRLLIAMHNAGLMQLVGSRIDPYPIRISDSNKLLRDRDGGLWIGTVERGLIHIHQGKVDSFTRADGLSGDITLSVFEDHEGSIWVSTTDGLDRFRELPVSTISVRQGLPSDATRALLAASDGSVWISTHEGLARWENGKLTKVYRRANGLPDDSVQALFQDHLGVIWAFTDRGLAHLKGDRFVAVPGVADGAVTSMTGDDSGNLWLSGPDGLWHLRDGKVVARTSWSAFGRHHNASVLLADPRRGGLWLGFWQGGGVSYFKDGRVRAAYTAANGLSQGEVTDLRLDSRGALWVTTIGGGVSRLDNGRISTLGSKNGLQCDTTMWTLEDDQRSLWMYMACGLVRIARPDLNAWIGNPNERVRATILGPRDGVRLRNNAASEYGLHDVIARNGTIWFLSGGGVQVVDPHHIVSNGLPPPVHIEQVIADGRSYWENLRGDTPVKLQLPAGTRDLEIDYAALSLVAPEENQFRYRLDGRDRGWYDAGNRRLAFYTDLPPGRYRFHVIASNNSGVWNEQGASIDFSIAPAFWQTFWFRSACGAALVAILLLLYWLRARQLALQFNKTLDARVQERTRIARDLHDTLLQSFQGVLLQFGAALRLLAREPERAREVLADAVAQAAHAINEGREAVQGLRLSVEDSSDLAASIARLAKEVAAERQGAGAPSVRIEVQGTVRPLHPIERDEIFRIAAEALRNAVHHSQGTQIEVELRYDPGEFRLRVRDNGRGIDPKLDRAGHFGLRGMRERAALAGGKLTLWSAPDAGTEVELVVPASRAYPGTRSRNVNQFETPG